MAGAVAVQVAREDVFESCHRGGDIGAPQEATSCQQNQLESMVEVRTPCAVEARDGANSAGEGDDRPAMDRASNGDGSTVVGDGERASSTTVDRHSRFAPYKPGKMTVVLDMDECLLHSKFHGPGAASEAYRQSEERPDAVNEVNSFWVALEDGDTAQVRRTPVLFVIFYLLVMTSRCCPRTLDQTVLFLFSSYCKALRCVRKFTAALGTRDRNTSMHLSRQH